MDKLKHAALGHPKMQDLAERISLPLYAAVGIMECLWHYAGNYTPKGDLGRVTDAAIARAVDWRKKPELLIEALVASGWIDDGSRPGQEWAAAYRLVIHDWPEHAQDWIRKKLHRDSQKFLPEYGHSVNSDQSEASQKPVKDQSLREGKEGEGEVMVVSVVVSKKEKSGMSPVVLSPFEAKLHEVAEQIHNRHPLVRRCSLNAVTKKLQRICDCFSASERVAKLEEIDRNHEESCQSDQWRKDGGQFAKGLGNWLAPTKDHWTTVQESTQPSHDLSKSEKSLMAAGELFERGVCK